MSGLLEFLTNESFLLPFLSTVAASATILLIQFIHRFVSEKKKKLYAVSYITDVCFRVLHSNLILKGNPILPHIEAVKRILGGDNNLLETMFLADEFDILTDRPFEFNHLPEEYKVLLGFDDIEIVQIFETITYLNTNEQKREALNEFVKNNLKSQHMFATKSNQEKLDCLNTYWGYLDEIKHQTDRLIVFVAYLAIPKIRKYIKQKQFVPFSKESTRSVLDKIDDVLEQNLEIVPPQDFLQNLGKGGIAKFL